MENNNPITIEVDDLIGYIQGRLIDVGYAVGKEEINMILDFEMEYMIDAGVVEIPEEK